MYCLNAVVVGFFFDQNSCMHNIYIYIKCKYKNVGPQLCDAGIKIPI